MANHVDHGMIDITKGSDPFRCNKTKKHAKLFFNDISWNSRCHKVLNHLSKVNTKNDCHAQILEIN